MSSGAVAPAVEAGTQAAQVAQNVGKAAEPLSDAYHAQEAARTEAFRNASVAGDAAPVQPLSPSTAPAAAPPGPPPGPAQSPLGINPQAPVQQFGIPTPELDASGGGAGPIKTAMERGGASAFKLIGQMTDFAKENPITSLGGVMTAQKLGIFGGNDNGPKKDEYERTPYAGLSKTFQPGGPSKYLYGFADGGPVEQMSNTNAGIMPTTGQNNMYPMSQQKPFAYANPAMQNPISQNVLDVGDAGNLDAYTGMPKFSSGGSTYNDDKEAAKVAEMRKRYSKMMGDSSNMEENISDMKSAVARAQSKAGVVGHGIENLSQAAGPAAVNELEKMMKKYKITSSMPKVLTPDSGSMEYAASGGIMHGLGGYSDGGRLLKGPGDGVSDSIPAVIGSKQPARLADGEFVIPARIVSELGNGSTEAGARQLYAMMERIQKNRKKSVGKGKVAVDSKAKKHLPA
jgi:hypothetical protein